MKFLLLTMILLTSCDNPNSAYQIKEEKGKHYIWIPGHYWPIDKLPEFRNTDARDQEYDR